MSIVYIGVNSWCTFYRFGKIYNDMCHLYNIYIYIFFFSFDNILYFLPLDGRQLTNIHFSFHVFWHLHQWHFFPTFIFISWRLITLQYWSGFCHTLTWISHGFTCIPHPNPPSHLPLHPIPLGLPSAPAPSTCLMHPTWAGDLFHPW